MHKLDNKIERNIKKNPGPCIRPTGIHEWLDDRKKKHTHTHTQTVNRKILGHGYKE